MAVALENSTKDSHYKKVNVFFFRIVYHPAKNCFITSDSTMVRYDYKYVCIGHKNAFFRLEMGLSKIRSLLT